MARCTLLFRSDRGLSESTLLKHRQKKHPREKLFNCKKCEKCFTTNKALSSHMKRSKCLKGEYFTCEKCLQIFTSQMRLHYHCTTKYKDKYDCKDCDIRFEDYQNWRNHRRYCTKKSTKEKRASLNTSEEIN